VADIHTAVERQELHYRRVQVDSTECRELEVDSTEQQPFYCKEVLSPIASTLPRYRSLEDTSACDYRQVVEDTVTHSSSSNGPEDLVSLDIPV